MYWPVIVAVKDGIFGHSWQYRIYNLQKANWRAAFGDHPSSRLGGFAGMCWLWGARIAFSICRSDHPGHPNASACCWFASLRLLRENRSRKISGHPDLWALATILRRKTGTEISQLHGINSAVDNHSIRCFANTGIDFPITEI